MVPCQRTVAVAVLLFIAIAAGSGYGAERSREGSRIGVSSRSIGFFDIRGAHENGFFRKVGIDSEIITIGPNLSVIALQAGEIDYGCAQGASAEARDHRIRVLVPHTGGAAHASLVEEVSGRK